eukprot:gene20339-24360_t
MYDKKLTHAVTAHPKIDPETKEMIFFGYELQNEPWCKYSEVDANGRLRSTTPIALRFPIMMHDFAITERYACILDAPLRFMPDVMIKENTLPFVFDK